MGVDWYDMIAKRNGGYKSDAIFTVEGRSGEVEFEERLVQMLPEYESVLDAGCGHGAFTLKMAQHTRQIVGMDNSVELLKIANSMLEEAGDVDNVSFLLCTTKDDLPFEDGQFDLIYDRRGPTSILEHSRIVRSGGMIFGIHSAALERVQRRVEENGWIDFQVEIFDQAVRYFPNEKEFAKSLAAYPGNPDYTQPEYREELEEKLRENQINGRLGLPEWRYIWSARKP